MKRPKLTKARANLAQQASNLRGVEKLLVCFLGTSLIRRLFIAKDPKKG